MKTSKAVWLWIGLAIALLGMTSRAGAMDVPSGYTYSTAYPSSIYGINRGGTTFTLTQGTGMGQTSGTISLYVPGFIPRKTEVLTLVYVVLQKFTAAGTWEDVDAPVCWALNYGGNSKPSGALSWNWYLTDIKNMDAYRAYAYTCVEDHHGGGGGSNVAIESASEVVWATVIGGGTTYDPTPQTISLSASGYQVTDGKITEAIPVGTEVTFIAMYSQTGYAWYDAASGTSASFVKKFESAGIYTISVMAPSGTVGGIDYLASDPKSITVTVRDAEKANQTVTISPSASSITAGASVTFSASGGVDSGYSWGGSASGSSASRTVSFPSAGTYTVTVGHPGNATTNPSNTATATVTVSDVVKASQTVTISPATYVLRVGDELSFTASGAVDNNYIWEDNASGGVLTADHTCKTIFFGSEGEKTVTVQHMGNATTNPSNVATATVTVLPALLSQSVDITPKTAVVAVGQPITFTGTGGAGTGAWSWSVAGHQGSQTCTVTYNTAGTYNVFVQKAGDTVYDASNKATATVEVHALQQDPVTLTPMDVTIPIGTPVKFQAAGGSGEGAYMWKNPQWSSLWLSVGSSWEISYNKAGEYEVSLYREGDTLYLPTQPITAKVHVVKRGAVLGITPETVTVFRGESRSFRATGDADAVNAATAGAEFVWSGPNSSLSNGMSGYCVFDTVGTFQVTVMTKETAKYQASNVATATVTVIRKPQQLSLAASSTLVLPGASVRLSVGSLGAYGWGTGNFVFGGAYIGEGSSSAVTVTAPTAPGQYTYTVSKKEDINYDPSNTASVTVTVSDGPYIKATPQSGSSPLATVIEWGVPDGLVSTNAGGWSSLGDEVKVRISGDGFDPNENLPKTGSRRVTLTTTLSSEAKNFKLSTGLVGRSFDDQSVRSQWLDGRMGGWIGSSYSYSSVASSFGMTDGSEYMFLRKGYTEMYQLPLWFYIIERDHVIDLNGSRTIISITLGGNEAYNVSDFYLNGTWGGSFSVMDAICLVDLPSNLRSGWYFFSVDADFGEWVYINNSSLPDWVDQNKTAACTVTVTSASQTTLKPLVSDYTVTDASHPAHGKTYKRVWQEGGGWAAYLGRTGVRFKASAPTVKVAVAAELQGQEPGGAWATLATAALSGTGGVEHTFSVCLGEMSVSNAWVPASYEAGAPKTGAWQFRARFQEEGGAWGELSEAVSVSVVLPLATVSETVQTIPPAGGDGAWFKASKARTFSLPVWIP